MVCRPLCFLVNLIGNNLRSPTSHVFKRYEQAFQTVFDMRIICILFIGLVSFRSNGQGRVSDSVLYTLTLKTIGDWTSEKTNVYYQVTTPSIFWDVKNKRPQTSKYLPDSDLETISNQVNNPQITTWDHSLFAKENNIKLRKRQTRRECLFISLPIVSKGMDTVVVYYETWTKMRFSKESSGAGFVAVWVWTSNKEWVLQKQDMVWIT